MKTSPVVSAVIVLLLASCAATTKEASWINPEKAGQKIRSVFIIGAAREELTRRLFEDKLSGQLAKAGVRGIASYRHMDLRALEDKQATEAKVKEVGAESVIIAKVVGERTERVVNPGYTEIRSTPYLPTHYGNHWHDFYRGSYSVVSQPPTVTDFQVVTVETSLYGSDASMIWSMRSETATVSGRPIESTIEEFVDIVIKDLSDKGLI